MILQVFTQINQPKLPDEYSIWVPCLTTNSILSVCPIQTKSVFVTHINGVKYYEGNLKNKRIYCIGPVTEHTLLSQGYEVVKLADKANNVVLPDEPITWLHGDTYKRDFSIDENVTAQQVYETSVDYSALDYILHLQTKFIWIYSPKVLAAIEKKIKDYKMHLYCTDSCSPNVNLWRSVSRFYPTDTKYE